MPEKLELFESVTDRLQTNSRQVKDTSQHWLDTSHTHSIEGHTTVKWFIHSLWSRYGHHPDMLQSQSKLVQDLVHTWCINAPDTVQTLSRQVPDTLRHISGSSRNSSYIFYVPDIVKSASWQCPDMVQTPSIQHVDTIWTPPKHLPYTINKLFLTPSG